MNVQEVDINILKPSEYNPRRLSKKQAKELRYSLENFDLVEPLVVNNYLGRENVIIGGHQRFNILKEMGRSTVPVVYVELAEEQEKELNLRLNKNLGGWNWDMLANYESPLLEKVGFDLEDIKMNFDTDEEAVGEEGGESSDTKTKCPNCGHEF